MNTIIINGQIQQTLPATDRSITYGDGLFETIACVNGCLQFFSLHLQRLNRGCQRLGLPVIEASLWLEDIQQLNIQQDCVVKLLLSRGSGGRGYKAPATVQPTRLVSRHPWPSYPPELFQQGARLRVCNTPVSINPALAGIKHLNRLDNVLARNEWDDINITEGLMCDPQGHVIEGCTSNLFAIENNVLYTPLLDQAGVAGIIRQQVIDLARQLGDECQQVSLSVPHLLNMDELFITNSLMGICPVGQLEDRLFTDWPVTQKYQQALQMDAGSQGV